MNTRSIVCLFTTLLTTALSGANAPATIAPPAAAPLTITPAPDDPNCTADDRKFMARAFELARKASIRGDGPIGAVLVKDGRIICEFGNTVNTDSDPTMHGETGLISYASHVLEKSLWENSTLYTSLEPCLMCTGSIHWAGIKTVVYGGTVRQPSGPLWGPERLRMSEVYKRNGWDITVRGPLMDAEHLALRSEHQARLAAKTP
jgi:tRNA(Arg) A34 adenosine deaminase TadA